MSPSARFALGAIVATPGALRALEDARQTPLDLLARHITGDWGTVEAEDWKANDRALSQGGRLLSAYTLISGVKLWVITESDRSATTFLLPSEY